MKNGANRKNKNRTFFLMICIFIIGIFPLSIHLFALQIINHEKYQQKALDQQTRDTIISPKRGVIYDRNMQSLAESATVETVYISPVDMRKNDESAEEISKGLSEILKMDYEKIFEMTKKDTTYQVVKKWIEKDQATAIRKLKKEKELNSIVLIEDTKRYYPFGNFASHILGFVGTENKGLNGIEALYDKELSGEAGVLISPKDPRGGIMPYAYEKYVDPQNGLSVVLTIDEVMQHYLEKHLETALVENNLRQKAMGIIMNVNTGEVLAMAAKGDYDPNNPFEITNQGALDYMAALPEEERGAYKKAYLESELWRNNLISDAYEPGSVFKILTASMALDEGVVTLNDGFYCPGYKKVGNRRIGCWKTAGHGAETFIQGIQNSCNPVFMEVGARLGREAFYRYQTAFGFGEKTGIDLPGEGSSIRHTLEGLNEVELATSAFGQTFKVTPIQIITAISAVANGGTLYKPYLVKELVDQNGVTQKTFEPVAKRQVISEETSKHMREALESVVSVGTGKNAYIPGMRVAGKTGTSEKTDQLVNGQADRTKRIASFAAFAPANDPEIAIIIILDEPANPRMGGGAIAAPVAGAVLEECLKYMGVAPQYTEKEQAKLEVATPNVANKTVNEGTKQLRNAGISYKVIGGGENILEQIPRGGTKMPSGTTIYLFTGADTDKNVTVPNIKNMTPAQARTALQRAGLNVSFSGLESSSGAYVYGQNPAANSVAVMGSVVSIDLRVGTNLGE